ncbi:LysR family transcriptional regulator|uniref:DNA-binding transcriptional regulator, LysR family n=1 Tax=Dendrosporobacter quercicolus TaxID=146817 RepID=A0A1G9YHD4_9FIRM|nr:LysR family transcriptional regulator [Dendrosporobacter quercicolus]NSL47657.1 LysR family transcriptional regulator [Dendrosporobacter quercicolus DSM 1736]SDN08487.1 DNA-binding transcriptional regulator, LysR family [Dendrosporobacter quercicolus]
MEDRDWKIIKVLSAEKNITKAAQVMYMSQPALTARLRQIEQEFGVQIVHRSSKGIQFTPAGELLVEMAEEFIDRMEQIKDKVRHFSNENAGTLVIGASNYFTIYTLPQLLHSFKDQYPNTDFTIITDWSRNIFNIVYAQKAHVGFVSVDYGGVKNIHCLFEEPICVSYYKPFSLADLPKLPLILYQSDYMIQSRIDKWWRRNLSVPPIVGMRVNNLVTCKEMVQYGLGYAFLPRRMTQNIESIYTMEISDADNQKITRKTWLIYNEQSINLSIVQTFVDFIKNTRV